jgi:hypothetical protein
MDFWPVIRVFCPLLRDIGPFFRKDFGRKLGDDNQLQIYINKAFLRPWRRFREDLC